MLKSMLVLFATLFAFTLTSTAQPAGSELVAKLIADGKYSGFATYTEKPIDDGRILQILEVEGRAKPGECIVIAVEGQGIAEVVADREGKFRYGLKSVRKHDRDDGKIPAIERGYRLTAGQSSGFFQGR